ncbi:malto-oligosyltrehalose trehalohydrolase [Corynebacterium tapiri]|uniref:Malto-oligosyltrehalose trehalohydrolase n=1 Tax=Corynebacterium tapiri TaxID=1448266 RepID=A0A5C4U6K5_9CORY|nr:malto-oligosyltrehalose trehalohydrolase [Corynebacterium tapiri]TNL99374.1 malto-oligosyltrehalose trehalohydrolase [Corynebacterium tapiri]
MSFPLKVWAPYATDCRVLIDGQRHDLTPGEQGWFGGEVEMQEGSRYGFELLKDGEWSTPLPDPRTRSQPEGVHGLSEWVTADFAWNDHDYAGRQLNEMVIYELHTGVFTPEGTLDAAAEKLDYLQDLGINTVQLMPVQPFGGDRNWGYDGVELYAVHASYGGPRALKRFVDAAHQRGMAVLLDVVFNHFGPDGNYLGAFGPYTAGGSTGWGEVVNLSMAGSDHVRSFVLGAVRQWLEEFHVDGLRLDAVHAYDDRRAYSIMEEMRAVADEVQALDHRPRTLIAESDLNNPRLITPQSEGGFGLDGQWVDDIHHGLHSLVSGETEGYYCDYGTLKIYAEILRRGWRFNNDYSEFRQKTHGRPLDLERTPSWRLVTYTTTHDQTGNRAAGDRPSMYLSPRQQVLKATLTLLSPFTPMLFMGEEFGARTPFPFFCSHTDADLLQATRDGRRREFANIGWDENDIPDPAAEETFESAKLVWNFDEEQQEIHAAYKRLLALRAAHDIAHPRLDEWMVDHGAENDRWLAFGHGRFLVVANLSDQPVCAPYAGEALFGSGEVNPDGASTSLGAWSCALLATR